MEKRTKEGQTFWDMVLGSGMNMESGVGLARENGLHPLQDLCPGQVIIFPSYAGGTNEFSTDMTWKEKSEDFSPLDFDSYDFN